MNSSQFNKFCRENDGAWLVCTVPKADLRWLWESATKAERDKHKIKQRKDQLNGKKMRLGEIAK